MEKKKLELRISYTIDSDYSAFVDYFQRHRMSPRSVFLDAIRLLWEPYLISEDGELTKAELERLVDISFQRYLNHYQLMCVTLGLKRPGFEGFSPVSSSTNGASESLMSTGKAAKDTDFLRQSVRQVSVPNLHTDGDGDADVDDLPDIDLVEGGFDFD